jgi:hypothetical protein
MKTEMEIEASAAITIALAIIPMTWLAHAVLAVILAGLISRIIWLSIPNVWERCTAIAGAVAVLAALLVI